MKLFKLIKSLDYVGYPSYKELIKISHSVSSSVANIRGLLISAIVGVLFDKTPLSKELIALISKRYPGGLIERIATYENAPIIISVAIATSVYLLIILGHFICTRWGSNKDKKSKRDILVYEFYNVAIPQLIEVKSILEQVEGDDSGEDRKKLLLLLQAKHEICELYRLLHGMKIIEKRRCGSLTDSSSILCNRIGKCTYTTFQKEMLNIMSEIYIQLSTSYKDVAKTAINDLHTTVNSVGVFDRNPDIVEELGTTKEIIKLIR